MDLYPEKVFFHTNEKPKIHLEGIQEKLSYRLYQNETLLLSGVIKKDQASLLLPFLPEGSYGLEMGKRSTAFEVSDHPYRHPRYGFLCDFAPEETSTEYLTFFKKMHLNIAQFYDWMYRHEDYFPKESLFTDPMGKRKSEEVIATKLSDNKKNNILSFAYGAIYGATNLYGESHPEERFYDANGKPYTFIDRFSIMNFATSHWRQTLLENYQKAVNFGFEGIHMDTYGSPKEAFDAQGKEIFFAEEFPILIGAAVTALQPFQGAVTFNNVSAWPCEKTFPCPSSFDYVEVWSPFDGYSDLLGLIEKQHDLGKGKSLVLAAYLQPFYENDEGALHAALYLDAVIAAGGAFHLMYGGNGKALRTGYYPDNASLNEKEIEKIRQLSDFALRYGDYLFDSSLEEVSKSEIGGPNGDVFFSSPNVEATMKAGRVFALLKEKRSLTTLSLINFQEQTSLAWNEKKEKPKQTGPLSFHIRGLDGKVRAFWASPENATMEALPTAYHDGFLWGVIPSFALWGLLVVKRGGNDD